MINKNSKNDQYCLFWNGSLTHMKKDSEYIIEAKLIKY